MTLEEKASVIAGTGMRFGGNGPVIGEADGRVPGAAGNTMNVNRFGIPGTVLSDGPAGVRIDPFHKGETRNPTTPLHGRSEHCWLPAGTPRWCAP